MKTEEPVAERQRIDFPGIAAISIGLVSFLAGPPYDRVGPKRLAAFGAACITFAPFAFSRVEEGSGYGALVVGMIVLGVGIGNFYPTATTAGVTSVDDSQSSLVGGRLVGRSRPGESPTAV